jgi:hypothetical protein
MPYEVVAMQIKASYNLVGPSSQTIGKDSGILQLKCVFVFVAYNSSFGTTLSSCHSSSFGSLVPSRSSTFSLLELWIGCSRTFLAISLMLDT